MYSVSLKIPGSTDTLVRELDNQAEAAAWKTAAVLPNR